MPFAFTLSLQWLCLMLLAQLACCSELIEESAIFGIDFDSDRDLPAKQPQEAVVYGSIGRLVPLKIKLGLKSVGPDQPEKIGTSLSVLTRHGWSPEPIKYISSAKHYDLQKMHLLLNIAGFNASARTIIIIPGYMHDDPNVQANTWTNDIANRWVDLENVNVIQAVWKLGASRLLYWQAAANTRIVGRQIAIFLHYVAKMYGTSLHDQRFLDKIQLVGHSLGAHIAGFVGKDLGGLIPRITGLDPAGPAFNANEQERKEDEMDWFRLSRSDARLVDVISTNGGDMRVVALFKGVIETGIDCATRRVFYDDPTRRKTNFGTTLLLGHLNFQANDGEVQPGCESRIPTCDHDRAHQLYLQLLKNELQLRAYGSLPSEYTDLRQLAVGADNYSHFASGAFLEEERFGYDLNTATLTPNNLILPIDVTKATDEYLAELHGRFNVDEIALKTPRKFYFGTRGDKELIGDTFVARLRVSNAEFWQPDRCALKLAVSMDNSNDKTKLRLDKSQLSKSKLQSGQFVGFAPLFVSPRGVADETLVSEVIKSRMYGVYLPMDVSLRVEPDVNWFSNHLLWARADRVKACSLTIDSLVMTPFSLMHNKLGGIYVTSLQMQGRQKTDSERLPPPLRINPESNTLDDIASAITNKSQQVVTVESTRTEMTFRLSATVSL